MKRKLDGNCARMLRAVLNKSWRKHTTKHQPYGYLPPISKTIQKSTSKTRGTLLEKWGRAYSDVFLWTLSHGRASVGKLAKTYLQQLCPDTGCSIEDLPKAMDDGDMWQERVREIRASYSPRWWWWWWWINIQISDRHPHNFHLRWVLQLF